MSGLRCSQLLLTREIGTPLRGVARKYLLELTMLAIAKAAFDSVKTDINTATLETLALFCVTGLVISLALVHYGPDVRAFELYGMVP